MLSRPKLTTTIMASVAAALLVLGLTACQHPAPPPPTEPPRVTYSETYDREIKEIMTLAGQNSWEEAQSKANALYQQDPKDKIRSIDAKNSAFNPTPKSLLTEQKDRGLPPRKDLRDAIDRIENTRYIPETYDKT